MKILIAVVAYNEEKNIVLALNDLKDNNFGYDIVVIDNGSYDKTREICQREGVDVISHCINSGRSSGTLMTYFLYAYRNNYDVLCQFDGDAQHIASELPKIIEPIKNNDADYVIGSRFIDKNGFQSYFIRRLGIKLFSFMDSKVVGQRITDVSSGFRAYNRKIIEFFATCYRYETYGLNQLLLLSHFIGARIKEVPVTMKERVHGNSEFRFFSSIIFILEALVVIIGTLLQKSRIRQIIKGK